MAHVKIWETRAKEKATKKEEDRKRVHESVWGVRVNGKHNNSAEGRKQG